MSRQTGGGSDGCVLDADRRDGARSGLAPQLWCEARRVVLSPTGTEDCEGDAAGASAQGAAATVGHVAAASLLLVVPTLDGDDGVDGTTVSFLLSGPEPQAEEGGGEEAEA